MHENVWWFCFLLLNGMKLTGADESNACSNITSILEIPEVRFCENIQIETRSVFVMNGYFAHSIPEAIRCSCIITTTSSVTLNFSHPGLVYVVPKEIAAGCSSEITVTNSTGCGFNMECQISGSINIGNNGHLNVVLTKKNASANTRYCVYITQGDNSKSINVVCSNNTMEALTSKQPTSTTTQCPTQQTTTNTNQLQSSTPSTQEIINLTAATEIQHTSTTTQYTTQQSTIDTSVSSPVITLSSTHRFTYYSIDTTVNLTYDKEIGEQTDYDKILYYSLGCGGGFVVFVNIILVTIVLCRRCSSTKSKEERKNDEDEDDELKYNVLYVSSVKDHEKTSISVDRLSFSIGVDANYSTVDKDDRPKCLDQESRMCNYSIAYISKQDKPENARKPMITEHSDHTGIDYLKKVTAPSGKGCEYAAVNKQGENTPSIFVEKTSSEVFDQKPSVCSAYAVVNIPWNIESLEKIPVIIKPTAISREQSETNISKAMKNVLTDDNNSTQRNNRVDSHNYTEIDLPE